MRFKNCHFLIFGPLLSTSTIKLPSQFENCEKISFRTKCHQEPSFFLVAVLVVVGSDVDLMYAPSRAVRLSGAFAIMQISHFPKYERTLSLKEERELFQSIVTLYGCHFDTSKNQSTAIPPYHYRKNCS